MIIAETIMSGQLAVKSAPRRRKADAKSAIALDFVL
jgi:hypothetical protein